MKRILKIAAACVAIASMPLFTSGCSNPTPRNNENLKPNEQTGRIKIVSAQVIVNASGYSKDILVLRDSNTGVEYIAVMGAGVAEMQYKSTGKSGYMAEE